MGSNREKSHKPIYKTDTKIQAKMLRVTTFDNAKLEERKLNGEQWRKVLFDRVSKIISQFWGTNNIVADCM